MTARKPIATQPDPAEQTTGRADRRRKRVDLHELSPNQLSLFEQEDPEQ